MKYLTFIRSSESYRESPPSALMETMSGFVERSRTDGTLVDTADDPVDTSTVEV